MNTYYNETENMLYNNAIISVVSITNEPNIKQCTFVVLYNRYMIEYGFDQDDVSA